MEFKQYLQQYLQTNQIKIKDLRARLNHLGYKIGNGTINKWLKGDRIPNLKNLLILAKVIDADIHLAPNGEITVLPISSLQDLSNNLDNSGGAV